jgi:D-erythronate 2-dehydrogenase
MRVLITGAHGFIGTHLTRALLARDLPLREVILLDVVPGGERFASDPRVRIATGDASDPELLQALVRPGVDSVFALGATLTSQAEIEFARGLEVNMLGVLRLLEACRQYAQAPKFVFTSSIAAFGGPLPEVVDDHVARTPQTSYGTAKAINELLINDFSRRNHVDGRALRLPIVLTRPPSNAANPAISERAAALIREPLAGRDISCPWLPGTLVPIASARAVADALLAVHDLPKERFGHDRALNLHCQSARIGELVDAVQSIGARRSWPRTLGRVTYQPDPALQRIVDQWPRRFESERARELGLCGDSPEAIIDHYIADYLES